MFNVLTFSYALLLVALLLAGMALVFFAWRVRRLSYRIGSFQCSWRPSLTSGWTAGAALYGSERVDWYRLISFSMQPHKSWTRAGILLETPVHANGVVEVRIHFEGNSFFLRMSHNDYIGFAAWTEAGPPKAINLY